jgi:hypothetical protein
VSKNRYVKYHSTEFWLLSCLASKIAELEKQVQLLASAVNTRGQAASNLQNYPSHPVLSNDIQSTGGVHNDLAGPIPEIQSNTWQRPPQPQRQTDHSLPNVASVLPSIRGTPTIDTALDFSENSLVRPSATMPRTIETLQLSAIQIDDLFQT